MRQLLPPLLILLSLLVLGSTPALSQMAITDSCSGTTSCSLAGGHAAGDLIIWWAYRAGSTTAPTAGTGTAVTNGNNSTGAARSWRMTCSVAVSGSVASGTWTNATNMGAIAISNTSTTTTANCATTAVGTVGTANNVSSATATYSALTMSAGTNSRAVLVMGSSTSGNTCTPAGATSSVASGDIRISFANATGNWSLATCSITSSITTEIVVEVKATLVAPTYGSPTNTYNNDVSETISCLDSSTGCYTTDGSTPAASTPGTCSTGTTYSSAFNVTATAITVKAICTKANFSNSTEADAVITLTVATPGFGTNGGSFANDTATTFSTTTTGTTHFCSTLDASTPTSASDGSCTAGTLGSSTTVIATATAVKAIGTKANYVNSAVATSSTFTLTVGAITDSPGPGTYTSAQTATLGVTTTTSATIHYTTDNSAAGCASSTYSSALSVGSTEHVRAVGCKSNYVTSAELNDLYTINLPSAGNFLTLLGVGGAAATVAVGSFTLSHTSPSSFPCGGSNTCSITLSASISANNLLTLACDATTATKVKSISVGGTLVPVGVLGGGTSGALYQSGGYVYPSSATAGPVVVTFEQNIVAPSSCSLREYTVSSGTPVLDWAKSLTSTGNSTSVTGLVPVLSGSNDLIAQFGSTGSSQATSGTIYSDKLFDSNTWGVWGDLLNTTSTTAPVWTGGSALGDAGVEGMAFGTDAVACSDFMVFDGGGGTNGAAATAANLAASIHGGLDTTAYWSTVATNHVTYANSPVQNLSSAGPLCGGRGTYTSIPLALQDNMVANGATFSWNMGLSLEDPNVSTGFYWQTDLPTSNTTEYIGTLPIFSGGSDNVNFMMHNHELYPETPVNPNGNPDSCTGAGCDGNLKYQYTANTWYWVTVRFTRYVDASSFHQVAIYTGCPASCTQVALMKKIAQSSSSANVQRLEFLSANDNGNVNNNVYVSGIKIDPKGTFPLLP